MSFRNIVNFMLYSYENNDIDSFFRVLSPAVQWKAHANSVSKFGGVQDKKLTREIWREFADPFASIIRQIAHVIVDERARQVVATFEEIRVTNEGDYFPLEGVFYFQFNPYNRVISVDNYLDCGQLSDLESYLKST
jgi:hypothetical protein